MKLRAALTAAAFAAAAFCGAAQAQLATILTTAMDARTTDEVKNDVAIAASANKRLIDDKTAQWKGVTLLVFAQHMVIAGAVRSEEMKKAVEAVVRKDRAIRSVANEIVVGEQESLVRDTALETEINAVLTATQGVSSVNMRWSSLNARVVLMGIARTKSEAALAVSKVKGIKGVKAVRSHLRVVGRK